ncbi:MAG: hypothetical protein WCJ35_04495 [Planctomycetota bacterium]
MKLSSELETLIRDTLAPLHPEKVILFGSYAWDSRRRTAISISMS